MYTIYNPSLMIAFQFSSVSTMFAIMNHLTATNMRAIAAWDNGDKNQPCYTGKYKVTYTK